MLYLIKPKFRNKSCKNVAVESEIFIRDCYLNLARQIFTNILQKRGKCLTHFIPQEETYLNGIFVYQIF